MVSGRAEAVRIAAPRDVLDQSGPVEVLDASKVADVGDRVRQAAETTYQPSIEAEPTDAIGAAVVEPGRYRDGRHPVQ